MKTGFETPKVEPTRPFKIFGGSKADEAMHVAFMAAIITAGHLAFPGNRTSVSSEQCVKTARSIIREVEHQYSTD